MGLPSRLGTVIYHTGLYAFWFWFYLRRSYIILVVVHKSFDAPFCFFSSDEKICRHLLGKVAEDLEESFGARG
jgi:hypothetical protein